MRRTALAIGLAASLIGLTACAQGSSGTDGNGSPWEATIVARHPHDANAFTQGLVVHDGFFYESTGQYGQSSLRRVEIETGQVERLLPLNNLFFGEGLTILGNRAFQLTWQNSLGFVYEVDDFELIGTFRYSGEGWGLTHDGVNLILSDGSAQLRFLDPDSFEVLRSVSVRDGDTPVDRLNELEYIDGEVWSNIWYDDRIARIDPDSGLVLGWIDLSELYPTSERDSEAVLNGIAYDNDSGRLFVTGKNWPSVFEIELGGLSGK